MNWPYMLAVAAVVFYGVQYAVLTVALMSTLDSDDSVGGE